MTIHVDLDFAVTALISTNLEVERNASSIPTRSSCACIDCTGNGSLARRPALGKRQKEQVKHERCMRECMCVSVLDVRRSQCVQQSQTSAPLLLGLA